MAAVERLRDGTTQPPSYLVSYNIRDGLLRTR